MQNVIERAVILTQGPALQIPLADLQTGDQKSEAGSRKSGVRDQKSEVRDQDLEIESLRSVSDDAALISNCRSPTSGLTLADAEREHILSVLSETGWVVGGPKGTAVRLGMKRSTLQKKMKKLGISRPD